MKKLMSLMIGMSLVLGAATMAFGDEPKKDKSEGKDKGKKKKKSDTPKKEGSN